MIGGQSGAVGHRRSRAGGLPVREAEALSFTGSVAG
jgi:hypothetical protein